MLCILLKMLFAAKGVGKMAEGGEDAGDGHGFADYERETEGGLFGDGRHGSEKVKMR